MEPLAVVHAKRPQQGEIFVARDSFGNDSRSDSAGEADERRGERPPGRIARDLLRQAQVEFHDVGRKAKDVSEVREAGADVVDRELRATLPQRGKCRRQRVVVVDLCVLGDLDHDALGDAEQELAEARVESGRR